VLVPFPFTDLSSVKRRPALVVSPDHLHRLFDDVILVAMTSSIPATLGEFDIALSSRDMAVGRLPKPSMVRASKVFTCHKNLIVKRVGQLKKDCLAGILARLRKLFM